MGTLITNMISKLLMNLKKMVNSSTMLGPSFGLENFKFGFNDKDFSDRILHIEFIAEDTLHPNKKNDEFILEVQSLHISSIILAAKSPYFYKLFKNGMMESQRSDVTLKINYFEKTPLMDVLNFMYSNDLCATTSYELLEVLMVADKFEVTTCMKYCIQLLLKTPMTLESALSCLELCSTFNLVAEEIQPLINASKQFLVARYKDFNKSHNEAMRLPLPALEVVLGSDEIRVDSEDDVFEFIHKWSRKHYPKLEERREILAKHLGQLIYFPYMSTSKLEQVLKCPDFEHEEVSKLVIKALIYKTGVHFTKDVADTKCIVPRRLHNHRDVKVVQLDFPSPRCVVYFDLKKEECADLFPSKRIYSQSFLLGGRWFNLMAQCCQKQEKLSRHFGLFLKRSQGSKLCNLDFEFTAMKKSTKEFETRGCKVRNLDLEGDGWGWSDLFGTPWENFMSNGSEYFIDGILHIRVDLNIINYQD